MVPPHLPPPTCSIDTHRRWGRLKLLIVATVFGLFAGVTGAFMVLGWVWPAIDEGDVWATTRYAAGLSKGQLEEKVQREIGRKMIMLYSKATETGSTTMLSYADRVGEAIVLSSDGWSVMYYPSFTGKATAWRALTTSGVMYRIDRAVHDPVSGLLYVRIVPLEEGEGRVEQFQNVVEFATEVQPFDDVFVWQENDWKRSFVENEEVIPFTKIHGESAPIRAYFLNKSFSPGAVVVTPEGRLVGISTHDQVVFPAFYISRLWSKVLQQGKVQYPTLGAQGWYNEEQPILLGSARVSGFVVEKIIGRASLLRVGDIITQMNGKEMTSANVWYTIEADSVRLKVYRDKRFIEIEQPIVYN